jgi:transposase
VIHPSHGVKIFVATKPVDFRKGHDGLAAFVQSHLKMKPFDSAVYVFRAKRADRLKMIWWDGTGLVMAYKRLEQNAFKWPTIKDGVLRLDPAQFEALFAGLDWRRVTALETRPPAAAKRLGLRFGGAPEPIFR